MRLLFVCTGNTCRSPLALAAWDAVHHRVSATLTGEARTAYESIMAASAGLGASDGAPAAEHSRTVAASWGVDLSRHRARGLLPEHVQGSDLILTMTGQQARALKHQFEVPGGRVHLLGSFAPTPENGQDALLAPLWGPELAEIWRGGQDEEMDILDPFGGSLEAYQACGNRIHRCVAGLAQVLAGATP